MKVSFGFNLRRLYLGVEYSDAGSGMEWWTVMFFLGPFWASYTHWSRKLKSPRTRSEHLKPRRRA